MHLDASCTFVAIRLLKGFALYDVASKNLSVCETKESELLLAGRNHDHLPVREVSMTRAYCSHPRTRVFSSMRGQLRTQERYHSRAVAAHHRA
jgi:hypothetical protein